MATCTVWLRLAIPEEEVRLLRAQFPGVEFYVGAEPAGPPGWLARVQVVFTGQPLSEELLGPMAELKWMHVPMGGAYHFLTPTLRARPVQVSLTKQIWGEGFAEFALGCILAFANRFLECLQAQREKRWVGWPQPMLVRPQEVLGQTVGVVGLGQVGSEVARKAKAIGLRVIATKRTVDSTPPSVDHLGPPEFLPALLAQADYVVLSLPAVPSTDGILGEKGLRLMKKTAYLINLTANRAVEEEVLARALREGWIAGAAVNAFARQPLPADSPLWDAPNLLVMPRIAASASQRWDRLLPVFTEKLHRFLAGQSVQDVMDKERGY